MSKKIVALLAAGLLTLSTVAAVSADQAKVDVCHVEGNESGHVINITEVAFGNVHEAHGDTLLFLPLADGTCFRIVVN